MIRRKASRNVAGVEVHAGPRSFRIWTIPGPEESGSPIVDMAINLVLLLLNNLVDNCCAR